MKISKKRVVAMFAAVAVMLTLTISALAASTASGTLAIAGLVGGVNGKADTKVVGNIASGNHSTYVRAVSNSGNTPVSATLYVGTSTRTHPYYGNIVPIHDGVTPCASFPSLASEPWVTGPSGDVKYKLLNEGTSSTNFGYVAVLD